MNIHIHNNYGNGTEGYQNINVNTKGLIEQLNDVCMDAEAEHIIIEHSLRCISNPLELVEVAMRKLHHGGTLTIVDVDTKRLAYDYAGYGAISQAEFNEALFGVKEQPYLSTAAAKDVITHIEKSSYKLTIIKQSFSGYEYTIIARRN